MIMGYFIVYYIVDDKNIKKEVQRQVNALGDYLAEHGYMLVRPCGGFTARGAAGVLPALEFPFAAAFQRITGNSYLSRASFQQTMQKANVWKCIENSTNWLSINVKEFDIPDFAINDIFIPYGLNFFFENSLLSPMGLAQAFAVYMNRGCFDVANDNYAKEFAVADLLMELEYKKRFQLWMIGIGFGGRGYAAGFPPFVGLLALDDPVMTVRNSYLGWLSERRKHSDLDEDNQGAKSCFASAVAVILGAGKDEEKELVSRLDRMYRRIHTDPTHPGNWQDDLHLVDYRQESKWTGTAELVTPELDYMSALALAWLYAKRRLEAGSPVTTDNFPTIPSQFDSWPISSVPSAIVQAARNNEITLPVNVIQNNPDPQISCDRADLFLENEPPSKSLEPAPIIPTLQLQALFDKWITVKESDGDVYTGVVLKNGDEFEFEANGSIRPGGFTVATNGPDGVNDVAYDMKYPLYASLDPQNAHPYCLLGKLNNYFFIGKSRNRERYFNLNDCPLYLRINDEFPGNGSGQFSCHIKVWRASP